MNGETDRGFGYRAIGLEPRKCDKFLFARQDEAVAAATDHRGKRFCADMSEYFCRRCQGWHIGHAAKHGSRQMGELVQWFDDFAKGRL